jgi:hypothetical protein
LYTELEKNIDASWANFVDKLLSGAINNSSRSLAINFAQRATARERQSLHCNKVDTLWFYSDVSLVHIKGL